MNPTNMVLVTRLNNTLNLKTLYELITLVPCNFIFNKKQNDRNKIPYFGVEKIIISLRYDNKSRGIRKLGGSVPNVMSLDLQYLNKNIHFKISKDNFVLMGILAYDMGVKASHTCLNYLLMINKLWNKIKMLDKKIINDTVDYVLKIIEIDNNEILMYDDEILIEKLNSNENINYDFAKYLTLFSYEMVDQDISPYEAFKNKCELIKSFIENDEKCFNSDIETIITEIEISNSTFNYSVDVNFSMIQLARGFHNLGYGVSYNNRFEPKTIYLMIPLSSLESNKDVEIFTNKKKIKAHRFQINHCGSIRQTSPTDIDTSFKVRNLVIKDLLAICQSTQTS